MREFVAKQGGRYTYIEDFVGLQDMTIALTSMLDGCGNFIVSGCDTSGLSDNAITISSGYVFINGHIRKFEGATVDLTRPYYIVESERTESVSYAQNATQQGCIYYECTGTYVEPLDKQYVKLTNTYIPRLKDNFFGKNVLLINPQTSQQTVSKKVVFRGEMEASSGVVADGPITVRDSGNVAMMVMGKESDGSIRLTYSNGGDNLGYLSFDTTGNIRFNIGGADKVIVSKNNIAMETLYANTFLNGSISIDRGNFEALEVSELIFNKTGRGDMSPKDVLFYDGKGNVVTKINGSLRQTMSFGTFAEESTDEFGLTLKDTNHTYREVSYKKSIAWKDKDGVVLGSLGYVSGNTNMILSNEQGDLVLRGKNIVFEGAFEVNGGTLDSQYATKTDLSEGLAKKVDAVSGMGLSEQNFTSELKAKLDSLSSGSVQPGDGGVVTGDAVSTQLATKLAKDKNLSDVNSKETARANLNVYSKTECDNSYARVNLSNLPTNLTDEEKSAIRTRIGAGASTLDQQIKDVETAIQTKIDDTLKTKDYASTYSVTELKNTVIYDSKTNHHVASSGGITFIQCGSIVMVSGTTTTKSVGQTLFSLPSNFGTPVAMICGSIFEDISKNETNRGLWWKCGAGSRDFIVDKQYGDTGLVIPFSITFIASTLYR